MGLARPDGTGGFNGVGGGPGFGPPLGQSSGGQGSQPPEPKQKPSQPRMPHDGPQPNQLQGSGNRP